MEQNHLVNAEQELQFLYGKDIFSLLCPSSSSVAPSLRVIRMSAVIPHWNRSQNRSVNSWSSSPSSFSTSMPASSPSSSPDLHVYSVNAGNGHPRDWFALQAVRSLCDAVVVGGETVRLENGVYWPLPPHAHVCRLLREAHLPQNSDDVAVKGNRGFDGRREELTGQVEERNRTPMPLTVVMTRTPIDTSLKVFKGLEEGEYGHGAVTRTLVYGSSRCLEGLYGSSGSTTAAINTSDGNWDCSDNHHNTIDNNFRILRIRSVHYRDKEGHETLRWFRYGDGEQRRHRNLVIVDDGGDEGEEEGDNSIDCQRNNNKKNNNNNQSDRIYNNASAPARLLELLHAIGVRSVSIEAGPCLADAFAPFTDVLLLTLRHDLRLRCTGGGNGDNGDIQQSVGRVPLSSAYRHLDLQHRTSIEGGVQFCTYSEVVD